MCHQQDRQHHQPLLAIGVFETVGRTGGSGRHDPCAHGHEHCQQNHYLLYSLELKRCVSALPPPHEPRCSHTFFPPSAVLADSYSRSPVFKMAATTATLVPCLTGEEQMSTVGHTGGVCEIAAASWQCCPWASCAKGAGGCRVSCASRRPRPLPSDRPASVQQQRQRQRAQQGGGGGGGRAAARREAASQPSGDILREQ